MAGYWKIAAHSTNDKYLIVNLVFFRPRFKELEFLVLFLNPGEVRYFELLFDNCNVRC